DDLGEARERRHRSRGGRGVHRRSERISGGKHFAHDDYPCYIDDMRFIKAPSSIDRRWVALVVLCFGYLMIVLDMTIVNVALPSIQHDLHFSQANLTWVVNAYLITYGGFLLLAGRLGDLIGRKRLFLLGLVVFTGASALCAAATSQ